MNMIGSLLNDYQAKINTRLDILVPERGQRYDAVAKAARYSLLDGGKRIRPIILLEFYKLCGGNDDCAYNFACALEMIHTYSLIHDDLPCMDNDDMRRGRPSCHKKYGETMALLAGDALLTEAFGVASKTLGIPSDRVVEALSVLAECAGIGGMVGGQVIDIENEGKAPDDDTLSEMYVLKTGALLRAAAVCGAVLAGADEDLLKKASDYGKNLGLAFQLIDDILDFAGDETVLGKPVGSDAKNDKYTFVTLHGVEKCRAKAAELTRAARAALSAFEGNKDNLLEITDYLLARDY